MKHSLTRSFRFEAAHVLPWHRGKCSRLHGHSYRLEVTITGPLDVNGIVTDFGEIRQIVDAHVVQVLDHTYLNDRFDNPTVELVASWVFETLEPHLRGLTSVRMWETADSSVAVHR
ncbi:6-carboxytetrahydropterin synthase QueD [Curtobacterium sp. SGAir0471]|uniref:6-carboxytetrahydropterin synthase QueD n=1 Tax=Curtobacterium sp. SGAir0471 TaxID=2070337 RepID=UPI0010CD1CD5|nr:6-carboxytetrahydropterin synthase QueD [Curtobacterium sp. SGAir0471]